MFSFTELHTMFLTWEQSSNKASGEVANRRWLILSKSYLLKAEYEEIIFINNNRELS